jgi:hypothetical protein
MADPRALSRVQLEGLLYAVRDDLAYPAAPDLAAAIGVGINQRADVRPGLWGEQRWSPVVTLAGVIVAAVLAGTVALAVSSEVRAVFYDAIEGVTFDFVESGGETPETPDALARQLGTRVSLEEAQAAVDFDILLPSQLGDPDEVYLNGSLPGGVVTLLYRPDDDLPDSGGFGLLVTQFAGRTVKVKEVPSETTVEEVSVDGRPGYWIAGPHTLSYRDAAERDGAADFRRSGQSLVWERDGVTLRLESGLGRDESIALAGSLE